MPLAIIDRAWETRAAFRFRTAASLHRAASAGHVVRSAEATSAIRAPGSSAEATTGVAAFAVGSTRSPAAVISAARKSTPAVEASAATAGMAPTTAMLRER